MRFRMNTKVNRLEVGADGMTHQESWFCGRPLEFTVSDPTAADVAFLTITPIGGGEPVEGYCHRGCADRAKGSLRF
jgi:hypothetical protein